MIKTEFSYSKDEIYDFYYFHLTTKTYARILYYVIAFLFLISGVIFTFIIRDYLFGLILLVLSVLVILLFPSQQKKALRKLVTQKYKRDKQGIIFYEDRIETIIENVVYTYSWDDILEVNETSKYIYLYVGKSKALIIKKSILGVEDLNELIVLIKKNKGKITLYPNI